MKVYPSIIINEESYRNTTIPKHWNLKSDIHTKDIGTIISQEFNPLIPFYSNAGLKELLAGVIQTSDTLLHIMNATPFYANIKQHKIMQTKSDNVFQLHFYDVFHGLITYMQCFVGWLVCYWLNPFYPMQWPVTILITL